MRITGLSEEFVDLEGVVIGHIGSQTSHGRRTASFYVYLTEKLGCWTYVVWPTQPACMTGIGLPARPGRRADARRGLHRVVRMTGSGRSGPDPEAHR